MTSPMLGVEPGGPADERLAQLARDGDHEAFAAIVERYQGELLAHARRLVADGRADDVVQQAFLNAWSALRAGAEVSHLRGWLHAIVRNTASHARGPVEAPLPDDADATEPLEELVQRRATARATLSQINELPTRQRDALVSTALHGIPRARVASRMGLSEGAVRQLVHRARATLRQAVAGVLPYPLVRLLGAGANAGSEAVVGGGAASSGAVVAKLGAVVVSGALATGVAVHESSREFHHHVREGARPAAHANIRHRTGDRAAAAVSLTASAPHGQARQASDERRGAGARVAGAARAGSREPDGVRAAGPRHDPGGSGKPHGPGAGSAPGRADRARTPSVIGGGPTFVGTRVDRPGGGDGRPPGQVPVDRPTSPRMTGSAPAGGGARSGGGPRIGGGAPAPVAAPRYGPRSALPAPPRSPLPAPTGEHGGSATPSGSRSTGGYPTPSGSGTPGGHPTPGGPRSPGGYPTSSGSRSPSGTSSPGSSPHPSGWAVTTGGGHGGSAYGGGSPYRGASSSGHGSPSGGHAGGPSGPASSGPSAGPSPTDGGYPDGAGSSSGAGQPPVVRAGQPGYEEPSPNAPASGYELGATGSAGATSPSGSAPQPAPTSGSAETAPTTKAQKGA